MNELLNMGGYGGYIWPAWGFAIAVLGALIVASLRTMRARERELSRIEAQTPGRRRERKTESASP